jgi:hypothetical protein
MTTLPGAEVSFILDLDKRFPWCCEICPIRSRRHATKVRQEFPLRAVHGLSTSFQTSKISKISKIILRCLQQKFLRMSEAFDQIKG